MTHEISLKNNKKRPPQNHLYKVTFYHTKYNVLILYKTPAGDLAGGWFLMKKLANRNLWQRLGLGTTAGLCFASLLTHLNSKYTLDSKHHEVKRTPLTLASM